MTEQNNRLLLACFAALLRRVGGPVVITERELREAHSFIDAFTVQPDLVGAVRVSVPVEERD